MLSASVADGLVVLKESNYTEINHCHPFISFFIPQYCATFRFQQRRYIQAAVGYRERLLQVFCWISCQALPKVNQVRLHGLNYSEKCQTISPAPPEVVYFHPKPTRLELQENGVLNDSLAQWVWMWFRLTLMCISGPTGGASWWPSHGTLTPWQSFSLCLAVYCMNSCQYHLAGGKGQWRRHKCFLVRKRGLKINASAGLSSSL